MVVIVEDAGLLACGPAFVVLALRLLVAHAYVFWKRRRSRRRGVHSQGQDGPAASDLSAPLLPSPPHGRKPGRHYVLRNHFFAWSREACAILVAAVYVVRACTMFYHGKDTTAGARLLLVAGGWLIMSQVEESPAVECVGRCGADNDDAQYHTTTPAWLTLTLGYLFYGGLAVHTLVPGKASTADLSRTASRAIVISQVALVSLILVLLAVEATLGLLESRERQAKQRQRQQQRHRERAAAGLALGESGSHSQYVSLSDDIWGGGDSGKARSVARRGGFLRLFRTVRVAPTAEQRASLLSTLVFGWVDPIIALGKRKILALEDLGHLEQDDLSASVWKAFVPQARALELAHRRNGGSQGRGDEQQQQRAQGRRKAGSGLRLFTALVRTWPFMFAAVSFFQLISSLAQFGIPLALKYLVDFIRTYDAHGPVVPPKAYVMAGTLFVAPALAALCNVQQFKFARRLIFRWRAALIGLVFRQALRLDPSVATYSSGQVINLCSVDASNCDSLRYFPFLWSIPLEVGLSIGLIFWVLKCWVSGLVGVVLVTLSVFVTVRLSERLRATQKQLMRRKDARLSLLGEILHGIRVVKLLAWERDFQKKLEAARGLELASLRAFVLSRCLVAILWASAPILVSVFTFLLHTLVLQRDLSASQGYATLALFGILREPLSSLSSYVNTFAKAQVSFGRLERFFLEAPLLQRYEGRLLTDVSEDSDDEEDGEPDRDNDGDDEGSGDGSPSRPRTGPRWPRSLGRGDVVIQGDASFRWGGGPDEGSSANAALLSQIHLHARAGELVCIYGATGAGKSSLLMALLGEIRCSEVKGAAKEPVLCCGSVSYAAQRPWILHGTVRDNILFGQPMEPDRYEAALEACALRADLESWEGGDLTEVGERGVQLSGGQQQRLSLARAIYARTDIVLLDDVLSAVDAHVARHILTRCLTGPLLEGRTCILVTHQAALTLPVADQVVVIGEGGRVALQGRPKEGGVSAEVASFMAQHVLAGGGGIGGGEEENEADGETKAALEEEQQQQQQQQKEEEEEEDKKKEGGGGAASKPLARKEGEGKTVVAAEQKAEGSVKLRVYRAYVVAGGGFLLAFLALLTFGGAEAFNYFQNKALGDWVEKLSRDDRGGVASFQDGVLPYVYFSVGSVVVATAQSLLTAWCALTASRRIHRDMAQRVLRAPMAWFETTPVGRIQNRFSSDMDTIDVDIIDTTSKFLNRLATILAITAVVVSAMPALVLGMVPILLASAYVGYSYQRTSRELKRLDSVTRSPIYSHFTESVAGLATIRAYRREVDFVRESERRVDTNDRVYHHMWSANRWLAVRLQLLGSAITGMVGVYLLVTLGSVSGQTAGLVLLYTNQFSDNMNSLIRQQAEMEMDFNSVERTAVEYTEDLPQEAAAVDPAHRPSSANWPSEGGLRVRNLRLRYPGTETDVLQGLSFEIPPHTRVGVVGRTGAGKTSLVAAIFRLVEPQPGTAIEIDGQSVLELGLEDLRSRLSICPQEAICFRGTVRSNLDPFGEFDDDALWQALAKAQLKGRVVASLDDPVTEGGANFSQGERALLCMSRALLRRRGLLVMDEATANVDPDTDARLQAMVRTELRGCTVLAIAHRLKTVAFYDRILVLDQGKVVEYDAPLALLEKQDSTFRAMAVQTGEFDVLMSLANDAQREAAAGPTAAADGGGYRGKEEVKDERGGRV